MNRTVLRLVTLFVLLVSAFKAQPQQVDPPPQTDRFELAESAVAFSALSSGGAGVSGTGGGTVTVVPDLFTGAFSAAIPIAIPPGRAGLSPTIAIAYRSDASNGKLGVGWSIDLDVIERRIMNGIDFTSDEFMYRNAGGAAELVSLGNNSFATKVEGGFSRIRRLTAGGNPPHWQMTARTGVKYTFGSTAESRQESSERPNEIYRWLVDRIEDRNGNKIAFTYSGDQGEKYLERIEYVEENSDPASPFLYHVVFGWEPRTDAPDSYLTGSRIRTAKRLISIVVRARGANVRTYLFDYSGQGLANSAMTGRTLLRGYAVVGADDATALPRTAFHYQTASREWVRPSWSGSAGGPEIPVSRNCFPGDYNNDARADVACYQKQSGWHVSLSTGSGWNSSTFANGYIFPEDVPPPTPPPGTPPPPIVQRTIVAASRRCLPGDYNGDGQTDFACYTANGREWSMSFSTGSAWSTSIFNDGFESEMLSFPNVERQPSVVENCITGDFAGSGRANIACFRGSWEVMSFNGSVWSRTPWTGGSISTPVGQNCMTGDYDGDTKSDLVCHANGSWQMHLARTNSWVTQSWAQPAGVVTIGQCMPGDFNGDGKADLACNQNRSDTWQVGLSTGRNFENASWPNGASPLAPNLPILGQCFGGDFNGDYLNDFACHSGPGRRWQVSFSTGSGFSTSTYNDGYEPESMNLTQDPNPPIMGGPPPPPQRDATVGTRCFSLDMSGDGKTDLLCITNSGWRISLAAGPVPDLLNGIDGTFGAKTTISYTPSPVTANTQMPMVRHVITRIVTADGRGADATTDLAYSGGFYHFGTREFRGFASAKELRPEVAGTRTTVETFFHQGADLGPVNDPTSSASFMKGKPYRMLVSDNQNTDYSEQITRYKATPPGAVFFFNPVSRVETTSRGRPGAPAVMSAIEYDYDQFGNITTERRLGDVSTATGDSVVIRTFALNTSNFIVGLMKSETVRAGSATGPRLSQKTFFYDGATDCTQRSMNQVPTRGMLTRVEHRIDDQRATEQRMAYDTRGNITCLRGGGGGAISNFEYDSTGTFLLKSRNALGHEVSSRYYGVGEPLGDGRPFGQLAAETDMNGGVRRVEYDALGRMVMLERPDQGMMRFNYEQIGTVDQHVTITSDPAGVEWQYLDGHGRIYLRKMLGPEGNVIVKETRYDDAGRVAEETMPRFEQDTAPVLARKLTYDAIGRLVASEEPDGSDALSCYGPGVMVTIDATGQRRRIRSDIEGRVVQIDEYEGTHTTCTLDRTLAGPPQVVPYATTLYSYDATGNLLEVVDAKGNRTTMQYDALGQRTRLNDQDIGTMRYTYDPAGNLVEQSNARGRIVMRYDTLGRLLQKDYGESKPPDRADVLYSYDDSATNGMGRLREVIDRDKSEVRFSYDDMGRVMVTERTVGPLTKRITRTYDIAGRLKTLTYDGGDDVVEYGYDGPSLTSVKLGEHELVRFSDFTPLEQPSTTTYGNGIVSASRYSVNGNACGPFSRLCEWTVGSAGNAPLLTRSYDFDAIGNLKRVRHGALTEDLQYDHLDRLTGVTRQMPGAPPVSVTYAYDQIGNMTFNSTVGNYTYGPRPHAVTNAGSHVLQYDAVGNLARRDAITFAFDEENRLQLVDHGGGTSTTFGYDAFGRRVRVKEAFRNGAVTGGSDTIYVGDEYVCEGNRCTTYIIAGGRRIAAKNDDGDLFYFHDDLVSSSALVTDAQGNPVRQSTYAPFGAPEQQAGGAFSADRPRFAGYDYDNSSGLYFMATRYYDPELSAFISPDSTVPSMLDPQSLNRFSYARQNPYTYMDQDGEGFWFVVLAAAAFGALSAGHASNWDAEAMFWGALAGAAAGATGYYVGPWIAGAAELGGAGAQTASILGGMAAGSAGGLASGAVYQIGDYDVDLLQSAGMGAILGGFGGVATEISGGSAPIGAAVESGLRAEFQQENPWQAALQGWAGAVGSSVLKSFSGDDFSAYKPENEVEVISLRPASNDAGNALWAYGVGNGYSHQLLAVGNQFYEIAPGYQSGPYTRADVMARYGSRGFVKAHVDLNANAVRAASAAIPNTNRVYFKPYVCTTYVNAITSGKTWGIFPGHYGRDQQR